MKKITSLLALFLIVTSCGVKQTRELITSGEYDAAIRNAVDGLRGNKNAKGKQDYIYLLEEAFAKAKERDLRDINGWFKDANPQNLEKIYNTYFQLNYRQEEIRPLLPLKLLKEGREAQFPFDDYTDQIVSSKNALSKYLYDNSKALLVTKDKMTIRRAYDDLVYLESINPGFKDVAKLTDEAKFILVEGNYLLLQAEPWNRLKPLFDFTLFINVGEAELERRLMSRIVAHGHNEAYAKNWIASNDMLNIREVQAKSVVADLVI